MQRYIARRALQSLLTLWVMTLIVFTLARISGNPLDVMLPMEAGPEEYERVSKYWGLDQPLHTQYFIFLSKAVRGDFGDSWKWHGESAMGLVAQRLPATLQLAGFALAISLVIALPIGVLAAVMKGTGWDTAAKIIALLGQSLPALLVGDRADVDLRRAPGVVSDLRTRGNPEHRSSRPSLSAGSRWPLSCGCSARPCWMCWTANL